MYHFSDSTGVHIGDVYHLWSHNSRRSPQETSPIPEEFVLRLMQVTRVVSHEEKCLVSEHIGDRWRALGLKMEFSNGQLDNINNDYQRLQDKVYALLTEWHDRESHQASLAQLTTLLRSINAFQVVDKLYRTLRS